MFESMSLLELSEYYSRRNRAIFGDVRERMRAEESIEVEIQRERIRRAIKGSLPPRSTGETQTSSCHDHHPHSHRQSNRNQLHCPTPYNSSDMTSVSSTSSDYGSYQHHGKQEDHDNEVENEQDDVEEDDMSSKRGELGKTNRQVEIGSEVRNRREIRNNGTSPKFNILQKPPVLLTRRQKMQPRNVPIRNISRKMRK